MAYTQRTDGGGITAQGNTQAPKVEFNLLEELYLIRLEEASKFERGEITELDLARVNRNPRLSHEIATAVVEGKPASLEAITLFIFDGPSIDQVRIEDHVRTWMNLEPYDVYGKLSLRQPTRKYGRIRKVTSQVALALLEILDFLYLHNLYLAARAIKKEKGTSKLKWDLVFNKTGQYDEPRLSVGKGSFTAMKYLARSREARRTLKGFSRKSGIDIYDILGRLLKRDASDYPVIYTRTSYSIPDDNVREMLRQGYQSVEDLVEPPKIVLWTGIEALPLRPNIKETGHRIHAITKISGVKPLYVASLEFHGPEFHIRQTANTSYFPK